MPRIDQRRLPLLVVLVAMLGVLGVVVADGWAARAAPSSEQVAAGTAPAVHGVDGTTVTRSTDTVAQGQGWVRRPGERAMIVQLGADQVRPVAHAAPLLMVLAALFVSIAGARAIAATVVTVVARPLPLAHVRRRGPPAPAVV